MLTNINSAEIKEVALLKDKRNYHNYLNDGRGNMRNIDINNVIIFRVKYDKKYVDDSIMPIDSGIDEKGFILIRESSNSPWKIDGVGEVDVMINFESGEEKVAAYDSTNQTTKTEETDTNGGKRVSDQQNDTTKVVMSSESGGNSPVILKTYKPKVIGVVIAAEGAESSKVRYDIEKAVSSLYGISVEKVNVYPMGI